MGVCFLQHRVVTGNNNSKQCFGSKYSTNNDNLFSGWYKYFKFVCIGVFSIFYIYMILISLAMTIDIGSSSNYGGNKLKRAHSPFFQMENIFLVLRTQLNQSFVFLLCVLCNKICIKFRLYSNKHTTFSVGKLFKCINMKGGMIDM